ncbi:hypothetical protein [Streptomyces decoyicus]|uniref:hypothetical protein n=1 Tax=Streptomyces decoyicus TaxID=249567 RepID=UPI002E16FC4F|nr:hypothetical protein OG532_01355 [Streptomyces decoyicus]
MAAAGVVSAALLAGVAPAQAAQSAAPARVASVQAAQGQNAGAAGVSRMKVLKEFDYSRSKNRQLPLRLGEYKRGKKGKMVGFGWTKIKKKHNITKYGLIGWLAKSPNIDPVKGQRYNLTGWAHRVKCQGGNCKIVDRRKMLLATDETMTATGDHGVFKYFGAVTAFCKGTVKCPTWVNTKFRPKVSAGLNTPAKDGERYMFTYKPLKEKKGRLALAS